MEKESKEVVKVVTSSNILSEVRPTLEVWQPETKADAIKMLFFIGSISATEDSLKKKCYDLLSKSGTQQNHYLPELDVTASPVTVSKPVYNITDEVREIEAEIKDLQNRLKAAKERAGINHSVMSTYYKIK